MIITDIKSYGYTKFYEEQVQKLCIEGSGLIPARVIEVHREQYKIVSEYGEKNAKLKGSLFYDEALNNTYPSVGDFILIKNNPQGDDIIYSVLQRKSKFSRLDSWNGIEQIVAANFDYVFITASLNKDFNIKRIERYLTTAWQSGGLPVVVLTKLDLCDDAYAKKEQLEEIAPGVPVFAVSSLTGEGLTELREYLKEATTLVFLGSSGVGKSSLVNAIAGEKVMETNEIREDDSKGRHTTTHRQLIRLNNGTMVIDTPGMRELGMWVVDDGLEIAFSDIEEFAARCKFGDCSHQSEPGCAVKAALASGELSKDRWNNYNKLKKETVFAQTKEKNSARRQEKANKKGFSKFQKEIKNRKIDME